MKVLRLSNSLDNDTHVAAEERTPVILRRRLEEELGFPVELENRNLWPSPGLPAAIERWLSTTDAEVVQFIINPFWYCYASVPMRMEKTPLVGHRIVDWGQRIARKRGISETAPFRAARRWAQGTVGAAAFFEPDEVITLVDQCVRVIVRHEDLVASVFGPPTSGLHNETQRGFEWSERRRQRVFAETRELCGRLHIAYDLPHEPAVPELWPSFRAGDFSHMNKLGHEYAAEWQVPSLVAACREAASVTVSRPPRRGEIVVKCFDGFDYACEPASAEPAADLMLPPCHAGRGVFVYSRESTNEARALHCGRCLLCSGSALLRAQPRGRWLIMVFSDLPADSQS